MLIVSKKDLDDLTDRVLSTCSELRDANGLRIVPMHPDDRRTRAMLRGLLAVAAGYHDAVVVEEGVTFMAKKGEGFVSFPPG